MDPLVECHCCRGETPRAEACLVAGRYYCVVCFALLDPEDPVPLCPAHTGDARMRCRSALA